MYPTLYMVICPFQSFVVSFYCFSRHITLLCSSFSLTHVSVLPPPDWAVPQSSRLKYRQLFNSHDKMMSGHLTGIYYL